MRRVAYIKIIYQLKFILTSPAGQKQIMKSRRFISSSIWRNRFKSKLFGVCARVHLRGVFVFSLFFTSENTNQILKTQTRDIVTFQI
jgi:hypothetical protein